MNRKDRHVRLCRDPQLYAMVRERMDETCRVAEEQLNNEKMFRSSQ